MRRFSETSRFDEDWYCALPLEMKAAFELLWAKADPAGVWRVNHRLAEFHIGKKVDWKKFVTKCEGRIILLDDHRYWLRDFVRVNCGNLSRECKAHNHVFIALDAHGISPEAASSGKLPDSYSVATEKHIEIEKEEDKETETDKTERAREVIVLEYLNKTAHRTYRPTKTHLDFIRGRLKEQGVTVAGCCEMIDRQVKLWLGTDMEKYFRPETLFNATKFSGYYDDRSLPLPNGKGHKSNGLHENIEVPIFEP